MAVKLPQLQKMQTTPVTPSNQRVQIKAQDQSANILGRTQAISKTVIAAEDSYFRIEDKKINNGATQVDAEIKEWNAKFNAEGKNYKGDPTDYYADYDRQAYEKRQEILKKYEGASDRIKKNINASLDKSMGNYENVTMRQRGAQQETYDHNMYETGLALKVDNVASNLAGTVRAGNPDSFAEMDSGLGDITNDVAKYGVAKGTVEIAKEGESYSHAYTDADGNLVKVRMDNATKLKVARERNKAVTMSIESMIGAGKTKEAQDTFDRYKNYMSAGSQTKITKKLEGERVNDEAYAEVAKISSMDSTDQIAALDGIKDQEVKSKAINIMNSNETKLKAMRKREVDTSRDLISGVVDAGMQNGTFTMTDLENSPEYKSNWDKLDSKSKRAIKEQIKAPSKSSSESLFKVQSAFFDPKEMDKVARMSAQEFRANYLNGLDESDKNKYVKEYTELVNPSNSQRRASNELAGKLMKDQLIKARLITTGKKNKDTTAEQKAIELDAMDAYTSYRESLGRLPTPEETRKLTAQIAASAVRKKFSTGRFSSEERIVFTAPEVPKYEDVRTPAETVTPANKPITWKSSSARNADKDTYRVAKGLSANTAVSSSDKEFLSWVREQREKK